jgi:hypothetical protein
VASDLEVYNSDILAIIASIISDKIALLLLSWYGTDRVSRIVFFLPLLAHRISPPNPQRASHEATKQQKFTILKKYSSYFIFLVVMVAYEYGRVLARFWIPISVLG